MTPEEKISFGLEKLVEGLQEQIMRSFVEQIQALNKRASGNAGNTVESRDADPSAEEPKKI